MASTTLRISRVAPDFDLEKNLCFRPFLLFPHDVPKIGVRFMTMNARMIVTLELTQKAAGKPVTISANRELGPAARAMISSRLAYCTGAREDLSEAHSLCRKDPVLSKYIHDIQGLRLFSAFNDFEGLLCILCSHMVSFNQYKKMIQRVYDAYGGAFPEPSDVLMNPNALDECGLGYRGDYVINAAKKFEKGFVINDVREVHGVGEYSENIFRLFQMRDYASFYEDSLTARIAKDYYGTDAAGLKQLWGRKWCGLLEVFAQKFINDQKPA